MKAGFCAHCGMIIHDGDICSLTGREGCPKEKTMNVPSFKRFTFEAYQEEATKTAIYPSKGSIIGKTYVALKLTGEAGEIAENIGKAIRDDDMLITSERKEKLLLELGDALWYISAMATELNVSLEVVARLNLEKLAKRAQRGTLQGSGDER